MRERVVSKAVIASIVHGNTGLSKWGVLMRYSPALRQET
jgi:hypothetical protein